MYKVKNNSKFDYHIYQESYDLAEQRRLALIKDFGKAFERGELELWYQPQFKINDGAICGAEALLRWNHPERGLMTPGRFLPFIENHELMHRLTLWVLQEVDKHYQKFSHLYQNDTTLAINVSPEQLNRLDVRDNIFLLLERHPSLLSSLHLEITETGLISQSEQTHNNIQSLREAGLRFWIDDFGTGYSSFLRLKQLPIDGIKIDRSFVKDINVSDENFAIVRSMIATARAFGISMIAEGVETAEELTVLEHLGCEIVQGFFSGHPMPESQLISMLEQGIISPNHNILSIKQVKAS